MRELAVHFVLLVLITGGNGQNCDFENPSNGLCGYKQDKSDDFDWTWQNGPTSSFGTGPRKDHTTSSRSYNTVWTKKGKCVFPFVYQGKTYNKCTTANHPRPWCATTSNYPQNPQKWGNCERGAWYAYIETSSPRRNGDEARLSSPVVAGSGSAKCLQFWYHMYGDHVNTFNVYLNSSLNSTLGSPVFSRTGSQENRWIKAEVNVQIPQPSQIVFEGIRGRGYRGDIAIDDVKLINGSCPQEDVCTFEQDFCGFDQDITDNFNWTRNKGPTGTSNTGPSIDHTLGSSQGYYLYTEVSFKGNGAKARISKQYPAMSGKCLTFWYMMYGSDLGTLNIYNQPVSGALGQPIWTISGDLGRGPTWLKGQVDLNSDSSFNVVFEGIRGTGVMSDIAIDDISVQNRNCSSACSCDFQKDWCSWSNTLTGDNFDWLRAKGSTLSSFTGPSRDRFGSDGGYYVFIEASSPRVRNEKAWLYSPAFNGSVSSSSCLVFWYHMYGTSIGELNIYQQNLNPASSKTLIWTLSGNKGNQWNSGQVSVGKAKQYKIIFEGVIGSSFRGDIAIDDFSCKKVACSINPPEAKPNLPASTTPGATSSPTQPPVGGLNCNFEIGSICPSWTQDTTDHFDWSIESGSTASSGTGPSVDHTTGSRSGYYAYIETSWPRKINHTARLISSSVPGTTGSTGKCLSFWYHMYGPDINRLTVYVRTGRTGSLHDTRLWNKEGTQGNLWKQAKMTATARSQFQFVIEGVSGKDYRGDIAIDDITVTDGACSFASTTCTFEENHLCRYTQDTTDDFNWSRGSASTITPGTGPSVDHTLGTVSGFYMFIEATGQSSGSKARFIGPLESTTSGVCLEFWYHMLGASIGSLKVYNKRGSSLGRPVWQVSSNQGDEWLIKQVTMSSPRSSWRVVFEGVRGAGNTGDIAIDDVKLFGGPCPNPGDCTFESGLCTWRNTKKEDNFDWLQGSGRTSSRFTGPSTDHTTGASNGTYMFMEASSPRHPGDKARLISEMFKNVPIQGKCVTFWYHMYGSDIGTLNVLWKTGAGNTSESIRWSLSGNQQNKWKFARFPLPLQFNTNFHVVFEAIRGSGYKGDIAIDDIEFITGSCSILPTSANPPPTATPGTTPTTAFTRPPTIPPGDYNCDFENSFCKYTQIHPLAVFNWTRLQGETYSVTTGPTVDHTIQQGVIPGPKGPGSLQHSSGKCIHVYDGAFKKPAEGTSLVIYDGCGEDRVEFKLTSDGYLKHTKFGQCAKRRGGVANPDDVVVSNTCSEKWQFTSQGSLQHINTNKCIMPHRGSGDSIPSNDNKIVLTATCNQDYEKFRWQPTLGWYAYIEASSPRAPNDTAILTSAAITSNPNGKCLSFWFHMYGPHIGSLNVYLPNSGSSVLTNPVWTRSGTHGNRWMNSKIALRKKTPFKIVFEGVRGSSYAGDIALDDIEVTNGACTSSVSCDFEVNYPQYCGWKNINGDNLQWSYGSGSTGSSNTGPTNDHTFGDKRGHYMYLETSGFIPRGYKAWLESTPVDMGPGKCLQFWYHMYGSTIGELNVYVKTGRNNPSRASWSRTRDQGNQWFIGQVSVTNVYQSFTFVFEAVRGISFTGDISIDDINLLNMPCNAPGTCDFEKPICTWTNSQEEDDFDWLLGSGDTLSSYTGPSTDHTTNLAYGKYMFIEASPRKQGEKARLVSERFGPTSLRGYCIRFWYHMYGAGIGTLNVIVKNRAGNSSLSETTEWSLSGNQLNQWRQGQAPVRSTSDGYQVVFEAVRGSSYKGDIAIDDITYTVGACEVLPKNALPSLSTTASPTVATTPPPKGPVDCDFESNFCGWKHDSTGKFNWTRTKGATTSDDTGPKVDHTLKNINGTYAYIETSWPRLPNDTARLISQPLAANTRPGTCVQFWYHMYGRHIAALNVYVKPANGPLNTPIWRRVGNQGNRWRLGQFFVRTLRPSQIMFEGIRGSGYEGDISLDDIKVSNKICPPLKECTFEETNLCGWSNEPNSIDDFDWSRQSGSTSSSNTGPANDHTFGTPKGFYMYIETSFRRPGNKARLLSPRYQATSGKCLRFWYHMYGRDIGTLNVRLKRTVGGSPQYFLQWSLSGNLGNRWRVAQVTISSISYYQIAFEGVKGRSFRGDIAIDDVQLKDNPCPPPGDCNFESDMCTWTNLQNGGDQFDWLRGSGGTPSAFTGPAVDHSTGRAEGKNTECFKIFLLWCLDFF